jgi:cellulase/cellobiase CelA1
MRRRALRRWWYSFNPATGVGVPPAAAEGAHLCNAVYYLCSAGAQAGREFGTLLR